MLAIFANKYIDTLRRITKSIHYVRLNRDNERIKESPKEFDDCLEKFISLLMAQIKMYWDKDNYLQVENYLENQQNFVLIMMFGNQYNKYKQAIRYYEPIVKKNGHNLLLLTVIMIANLCVRYIMIKQNEDVEELMCKLKKEKEKSQSQDLEKSVYYQSIQLQENCLNNYEFATSRSIVKIYISYILFQILNHLNDIIRKLMH